MIGRRLGIPIVAKVGETAAEHLGWFPLFASDDLPTSGAQTRSVLGWEPTGPDLLTDIDHPGYDTYS